ncbi:GNAT family N-acetyltransferase [Paracoccaceae bacterium GXU_MW_L88]
MSLEGYSAPPVPGGVIEGAHVTLRPLAVSDAAEMWPEVAGHDALWDYLATPVPQDEAAFAAHIAALVEKPDDVAMAVLRGGKVVGHFLFMRLDRPNGAGEIGWVLLAPSLQKTTAASEAFHLAIRHLFDLGYRRVEWKCNAANRGSRRAAQRLGFSYEGVFRQHMIAKGENRDSAWFAIIDSEWPGIRAAHEGWLADPEAARLSDLTRPLLHQTDPAL